MSAARQGGAVDRPCPRCMMTGKDIISSERAGDSSL